MLNKEPEVRVGIMTAKEIDARFLGGAPAEFELGNVTIGKAFHWERRECQRFRGELEILRHPDGTLTAVNRIGIEEYLRSVIGSEMSRRSPLELLKAHAVISRSWLLAQIRRDLRYEGIKAVQADDRTRSAGVTIDWQDREDHTDFDVCADDHCQRYQGVGDGKPNECVDEAIGTTRGEVLTYEGKICDARFSKCCGGMTEDFSTCWEPHEHPYLRAVEDPYCAEATPEMLERSLNGYDREDADTYRWSTDYMPGELEALLLQRSGIDFGEVTGLKPLKLGKSGRISLLEITGTRARHIVGKELTIRRWLSTSHLKSSAFEATRRTDGGWHLEGKGWGHGVGLCQIGAAVMACKGFTYKDILNHYYPGAVIDKLY
ncbi:MAG: SpoIID/LytB domain-containing protein [Muribaculaceae bacterium]|nr:SpoIID/LytB domain-containing protein [Muribaculaceae bacterium]